LVQPLVRLRLDGTLLSEASTKAPNQALEKH
jgi:hypothetical protein